MPRYRVDYGAFGYVGPVRDFELLADGDNPADYQPFPEGYSTTFTGQGTKIAGGVMLAVGITIVLVAALIVALYRG